MKRFKGHSLESEMPFHQCKELNIFKSVADLILEGRGGVYSDYTLSTN